MTAGGTPLYENTSALTVALVPPGVVTYTLWPAAAWAGETAVIWVADTTLKLVAATEPNTTLVAPVNPLPVIVTDVPPAAGPDDGESAVTAGRTPPAVTRYSTTASGCTLALMLPVVVVVVLVHRFRSVYCVACGKPTARAVVAIGRVPDPRLNSATARSPLASGLTHTWPEPDCESRYPCAPSES